jgi:ribosomal protein S18 acetylase RimI-like enzyme
VGIEVEKTSARDMFPVLDPWIVTERTGTFVRISDMLVVQKQYFVYSRWKQSCHMEVFGLYPDVKIEEIHAMEEHIDQLSELLVKVVEDGASIGFLPPLKLSEAKQYWESVLKPEVILFIAKINNEIVGSVQLHVCTRQNGRHRGEIAKLMTHPAFRRNGIGRALMQKAEERAKQEGLSLLVLDTREGDPSNHLYTSIGFVEAGRIPNYAKSANGELHATVFYYKLY